MESDKTAGESDEEFFECVSTTNTSQTSPNNQPRTSEHEPNEEEEKAKSSSNKTDEEKLNEKDVSNDELRSSSKGKDGVDETTEKIGKTCLDEELEESLTEEEKEDLRNESLSLKNEGNEQFKQKNFSEACDLYTRGLQKCPKCFTQERSVLFSNRAACYKNMEKTEQAIKDCTEAIEINPSYVKALLRRAQLYEESEKLDEAFADYKTVLEKDPTVQIAREACMRLPRQIEERNEKMKAEMMGKLKELGNMVLKPFGLSTNNFQMQQNPETGSYNVQFVQNSQQNQPK